MNQTPGVPVVPGTVKVRRPSGVSSPSGSHPSRRTTVVVRRFGFLLVAPFFLAASRAASSAWRARSTPLGSVVMR
ncbi:hypothetical protein OG245_00715 [Streptomyces sp. NBC_01116]|uniref:hypothetical protein n=1 Tax=Streptomyces sp. NBC_01116 TaxID=2903752 RepID=UPI00324E3762